MQAQLYAHDHITGWQKFCGGGRAGGPRQKGLDSDKNFKPEHALFCRELRLVAIYVLFEDLWAKKCLFGSKTVFLGQEVHYYMMVCIAYFTELIAITRKNDAFDATKVNTRLTKLFIAMNN